MHVQVSRNALVTLVEVVRVRCILLWHAKRWSPERAAEHSTYLAAVAKAEAAARKHAEEDEHVHVRPSPNHFQESVARACCNCSRTAVVRSISLATLGETSRLTRGHVELSA